MAVVALRKESVDRNSDIIAAGVVRGQVALRKESVDRNLLRYQDKEERAPVALRKESVDRNRWCCFRLW